MKNICEGIGQCGKNSKNQGKNRYIRTKVSPLSIRAILKQSGKKRLTNLNQLQPIDKNRKGFNYVTMRKLENQPGVRRIVFYSDLRQREITTN